MLLVSLDRKLSFWDRSSSWHCWTHCCLSRKIADNVGHLSGFAGQAAGSVRQVADHVEQVADLVGLG
jgi:hypothetical protein